MRIKKGDLVVLQRSSLEKLPKDLAKKLQNSSESFFVVVKGPFEAYRPKLKIDGKVYQSAVTLAVDLLLLDQIIKSVPVDCLERVERKP